MPDCDLSGQSPTRPPTQPDVPTLSAYATARGDPLLRAFMCWTGRMGFHAIGWLAAGLVLVFGSSYLVTTFVGGG